MTEIIFKDLTKRFRHTTALSHISLSLGGNKIIGLIGRNGSGKTTFLKTIAGHLKASSGEITVNGQNPFNNLNIQSELCFIQDETNYPDELKVIELVRLAAVYYKNWDAELAADLLKEFKLEGKKNYEDLSRGMKSIVHVVIGLASRAPLTIYDEPTLGLDAAVRKRFYSLLLEDYSHHPRNIIISSHLINEAENLMEEVVIIKEGRLLLQQKIEELQQYAVYLNGRKEVVEPLLKQKELYEQKSLGRSLIAVVKNDLTSADRDYIRENDIDISSVPLQELFIYLTGPEGEEYDEMA